MNRIDCEKCLNSEFYSEDKLRCRLKECQPSYEDMREVKEALLKSFKNSFINEQNEFIANRYANEYFRLDNCEYPIDVECKILEWFSRSAHKGIPYSQEWRNRKFRKFMQNGINDFLDTNFSEENFEVIYCKLGNAVRHQMTIKFIESGYDISLIQEGKE